MIDTVLETQHHASDFEAENAPSSDTLHALVRWIRCHIGWHKWICNWDYSLGKHCKWCGKHKWIAPIKLGHWEGW